MKNLFYFIVSVKCLLVKR